MHSTTPQPTAAYAFPNGMLMVFDQFGQQMPEFQGPAAEKLPLLRGTGCRVQAATWHGDRANPIDPTGELEPDEGDSA